MWFVFVVLLNSIGTHCLFLMSDNITNSANLSPHLVFVLNTNITVSQSVSWKCINTTVLCQGHSSLTFERSLHLFYFFSYCSNAEIEGITFSNCQNRALLGLSELKVTNCHFFNCTLNLTNCGYLLNFIEF